MLSAGAPQANAAQDCEVVTQYQAPIMVRQGPCVYTQSAPRGFYVTGDGDVLSGPGVVACTLYTKVWSNSTLIANSVRNCNSSFYASYYSPFWSATVGTRATAQTWFDVRYRVGSTYITLRFTSPRAALTVG
jgi:hypothetical protein